MLFACYTGMFAAFCIYMASIPLLGYFCTPRNGGGWNDLAVFESCKRLLPWAMIQGSCDIVLNIYILGLPLTVVMNLQMPRKRKLGVLAIFLTGTL
jgi:hypothetical protein